MVLLIFVLKIFFCWYIGWFVGYCWGESSGFDDLYLELNGQYYEIYCRSDDFGI